MFVRYVCFPVRVLGPGDRLGIWFSGCDRGCPGCMSPALQTQLDSDEVSLDALCELIRSRAERIQGVTISGGEPMLQSAELAGLLRFLHDEVTADIVLYTGFTREELLEGAVPYAKDILQLVSVLVSGPYVEELDDGVGLRGSSNQEVWRRVAGGAAGDGAGDAADGAAGTEDAFDFERAPRAVQSFVFGDKVFMAGLKC